MLGAVENNEKSLGAQAGCGPIMPPERMGEATQHQRVYEHVRAAGLMPRVQISKELDMSPASVTAVVATLIESDLLVEVAMQKDRADTVRGRPPVALGVRTGSHFVAGVRIADQSQTAVIMDATGRAIAEDTQDVARPPSDANALLQACENSLDAALRRAGMARSDLSGVGIGLPGFVDFETGSVHWSPILKHPELDFANRASAQLGVPVVVDNDTNLVALAELWFGAGRAMSEFAVVTIEYGVGMGLVLNNRLYRGARGLGMELGHVKVQIDGALCRCGQRGCLEAYVADYALAREAATALKAYETSGQPVHVQLESLFEHAKAGNAAARSVFQRAGRYLALGLANVINLFDPELIILSGERMRYDYLYAEEMKAEIERMALVTGRPPTQIKVQAWGDMLWSYGAAALALTDVTDRTFATPRPAQMVAR